jgi:RNA recognition motif-containing protein
VSHQEKFNMSTRIHISGLSYFCTDEKLRQAFIPFGTVVQAQVLRDDRGHALAGCGKTRVE